MRRVEFVNGKRVIVETSIEDDRAQMSCSRLQARVALGPDVCAILDAMADDPATPWVLQQTLKYAQTWQRTHPDIEAIGSTLGFTQDDMDALFSRAATL